MFTGSRRHRPPVTHTTSASTHPNAASAAASAFMAAAANQNANRSLSSAAAAAALRARPHTPINVGAVETKRTQRRSGSVSSHGSAARSSSVNASARRGRGLERRQSSGSMTERTFRTPSPSPHRAPAMPAQPHPPVPQIPANHRKTQSVGMQTFRTASQKMKSEPPAYYGSPQGNPGNVRTSDGPMRSQMGVSHEQAEPYERPGSRASSINYSYPTKFRPQSPPASPTSYRAPIPEEPRLNVPISPPRSSRTSAASSVGSKSEPALVYDPNSRRMVPSTQPSSIEYEVREAANRQPKKKKTPDGGLGRSGSHLAKGTMNRAKGTAVNNVPPEVQPARKPEAEVLPSQQERQQDEAEDTTVQQVASPISSPPERLASPPPARAVGKKPSMVREDPEGEEEVPEIITPLSQRVLDAVEAVPEPILEQRRMAARQLEGESDDEEQQNKDDSTDIHHSTQSAGAPASVPENKAVTQLAKESTAVRRAVSISPDRRARFGPSVSEQLTVRHQPLPRSASPIKSALKRSGTSSRDVSPSENGSESINGAAATTQDPGAARKKAVRVSFDERSNVIMGESAGGDSPASASPQSSKRPWYSSIGRSKKRDVSLDDDEVMKPRPALPSFGSIREKKAREVEERPLVRPSDGVRTTPELPSQSTAPENSEIPTYRTADEQAQLEASSDHAIGSVLARDHESRNEANTSRFREPLPPVVTSVDSNGYHMDTTTDDSDDDLFDHDQTPQGASAVHTTQSSQQQDEPLENLQVEPLEAVEDKVLVQPETVARTAESPAQPVPAITVILPSPMAHEEVEKTSNSASRQYFDVPGGFPDEDSGDADRTTSQTAGPSTTVFEPEATIQPSQAGTLPQTKLVTTRLASQAQPESEGSSDESIYSDAYEDISDMEGGFMSIDAVVESPITKSSASFSSHPPASPVGKGKVMADSPVSDKKKESASSPAIDQKPVGAETQDDWSQAETQDDWSQAETFWRSLTAEKRQRLAREVLEDEAAEGDREEVSTPVRRNSSRRKSAEQKKAAAEAAAVSDVAQDVHSRSERTYMIQPGSKATHDVLSTPEDVHMRKSLRGPQSGRSAAPAAHKGSLRKSMRGAPEPRVTSPTAADRFRDSRPSTSSSALPSQMSNGAALTGTGLVDTKAASTALAKQMMPKLSRRGSDASDSSFQRSRRPASSAGFAFRSSMRQGSASGKETSPAPRESTKGSGRWSLRSLSPPATFRRNSSNFSASSPPSGMMRQSLRVNSDNGQVKRNSIHLPFGRGQKSPPQKKSTRSSRFAGSSDEEEVMSTGFQSRFRDSSDEDERPGSSSQGSALSRGSLRDKSRNANAFRGATPVPEEPEDSPDLPDSDDEKPGRAPRNAQTAAAMMVQRPGVLSRTASDNIGTNALRRSGSGRGNFTTTITSHGATPPRERRGSFMGSILRRNKRPEQAGKIQRAEVTESAARRDTRLERDTDVLKELRADQRPTSPRLQRKLFGKKREDSWPLPQEQEATADGKTDEAATASSPIQQRPASSSGKLIKSSVAHQRPSLAGRRSTSLGLPGVAATNGNSNGVPQVSRLAYDQESLVAVSEAGGPRKKKFGTLRRMFGLSG
ncbi:uncharacterized protein B0I36DRAFT_64725 [Microdochium trichocladiopsis]|uniref:Uncharacterized protein n=1 Tax=Microdochium trichocladiopsis TaxID=1682393 RepID=A0A9P8YDN9_9PEZI|nr:uncharacterized protein B0I36DRAFT_64725 [Microdochium trichocladiopsis]KAH7037339.1 hypothetical protein B0I36DRAFT_64725 [Microdochium trichocladiopsis]